MSLLNHIRTLSQDILSLFYPHICFACENEDAIEGNVLCFNCFATVGATNHFDKSPNEMIDRIQGRVEFEHGAALYEFYKKGKIQKVIHNLKYKRKSQIGILLGQQFGYKYLSSKCYQKADYIIPIPIHRRRLYERGYNQCYMISKGISEITGIPILKNGLIKTGYIESQTKKARLDRFLNVFNSFQLQNPEKLIGKRVLIIDDVLTTGATIEAAIKKLKVVDDIKIQVGLMALAKD